MSEHGGRPGPADPVGDLAIVLHSHMPYVAGFGTYPFGEEWLFDAVVRSYLPVLETARDLTVTVTPVLADQLETDEVADRLREFLVDHRIGAARRDFESVEPEFRDAAQAELQRYSRALEMLDRHGGRPLDAFRLAAESGRICLAGSAATHALLPLMATRAGTDLQIEAGVRSHRRRFGWHRGFWLPECAYVPGLEWDLANHGVGWFCVDQSRYQSGDQALAPIATAAGPVAFGIDWPSVSRVWDLDGYPSWPGYQDFHRLSVNGMHIFRIDGGPYDRGAAAEQASEQADRFVGYAAERLTSYRERTGERGTLVFAVDCELLGHWWSDGPLWLEQVLDRAAGGGLRLVTLEQAAAGGGFREGELRASTWGEQKDFRTWDAPAVDDLTWAARRLELRVAEAIADGLDRERAERAVRELMLVQSSDWAFLDSRREAGDYAFDRATQHARNALESLQSRSEETLDPRIRSLAPDLSLTPMLIP
ncbi:MAG: DUF1957 domain-containing protein [Solirubrobacterales bacterium]|nr:DUF1957 domain-containing protein [Solirubrobacterales bacterium]